MTYYYEDFAEGQVFTTPARTITEGDLVQFTGLSGDYHPVHTDEEFSKGTRFGTRIAHGLLGVSIITGLMLRTGVFEESVVALLGIDNWKFHNPIFIGDTLKCKILIRGKRLSSKSSYGIVYRDFELYNQKNKLVQSGAMNVMILCRSDYTD